MPINLDRITHLCMAINAVEGTAVAPEYEKQNEEVRASLNDMLLEECDKAYNIHGASLKALSAALVRGGWDCKVIRRKYALKIVEA